MSKQPACYRRCYILTKKSKDDIGNVEYGKQPGVLRTAQVQVFFHPSDACVPEQLVNTDISGGMDDCIRTRYWIYPEMPRGTMPPKVG